jgi:hypothetical protein
MARVQIEQPQAQAEIKPEIAYYYPFKGKPMVRIKGNFMKGGFSISRAKVKAILENREALEKFAAGEFDKDILETPEGEGWKP